MTRPYEMTIEIKEFDPTRAVAIKEAANAEWPFDDWVEDESMLLGTGRDNLVGGVEDEEAAGRFVDAVWRANKVFCNVVVRATDLDAILFEDFPFDEEDYDEWTKEKP